MTFLYLIDLIVLNNFGYHFPRASARFKL